jgi:hypothetical protein
MATVTALRRPRRDDRSREQHVPEQPDPNAALSPHQQLAAKIERVFADHGRSLTDEDTAATFLITLGQIRLILDGARHQGILGEGEHRALADMVDGMMGAPGLLT